MRDELNDMNLNGRGVVFEAWKSGDLNKMLKVTTVKTNPIDRHFLLHSIVEETFKRRSDERYRALCVKCAKQHLKEFPDLVVALKENSNGELPRVTTFQYYATILTEDNQYKEAISVCKIAIKYGLKDGTESGFQERIDKIKKLAKEDGKFVNKVKCNKCGKLVLKNSKKCEYCGVSNPGFRYYDLLLLIAFFALIYYGYNWYSGGSSQKTVKHSQSMEYKNTIERASSKQIAVLKNIQETDKYISNDVYAVKSKQHENVWYVSTKIFGPGLENGTTCVWAFSGDRDNPGLVMAADYKAKEFTGVPYMNDTKASIGYGLAQEASELKQYVNDNVTQ